MMTKIGLGLRRSGRARDPSTSVLTKDGPHCEVFESRASKEPHRQALRASAAGRKRLLIVTDAWHPQINGVVVTLREIKRRLERDGLQVSLLHPGLFFTMPLPIYPEIRLSLFSGRALKRIIRTDRPDYIHIATEGPLGLTARLFCARHRIPFTTSFHTHFQLYAFVRYGRFLRPARAYLRWFHRSAHRTMVATRGLMGALEADNFQNLVLWPLGVDSSLFVRSAWPSVPALPKPVFTYFSRLAPEKNPEEFLRLSLPGTKLVIGDGPARAKLEAKYGTSAIFIGSKQGQELVDWLSVSDVVIVPSKTETFGLVILEALACGVPVAAHDVMGPRDILTPGVDGYLEDDLAKAALGCVALSPEACRKTALKYTWEASAQAFLRHLVATENLPLSIARHRGL